MTHELSCSIGGLVIPCHNKIRDELLYLSQHAFTSESVRDDTLIRQGRTISELEIDQGSDKHKDNRGDAMIRCLWDFQVDAIIDVKIGDADVYTYSYKPTTSILDRWENNKKEKYGKICHDQREIFSPFVL